MKSRMRISAGYARASCSRRLRPTETGIDSRANSITTSATPTSARAQGEPRLSGGTESQGKRWGVGRLRLPAKATPYVGAFLGGTLFAGVLLLLVPPMFAYVMTNLTGWWNAGELATEQKARQALETRITRANEDLEESRQETKKQKSLVADRESEIDNLNHMLSDSAAALEEARAASANARQQLATIKPPAAVTPASTQHADKSDGPESSIPTTLDAARIKQQLVALVLDKPLNREDLPEAQRLLGELGRLDRRLTLAIRTNWSKGY